MEPQQLIRAAVSDWCDGHLSSFAAMIVIHSVLYPAHPTEQMLAEARRQLCLPPIKGDAPQSVDRDPSIAGES